MINVAKAMGVCAVLIFSLQAEGAAAAPATISSVRVLGGAGSLEIEVVSSGPIESQSQVITGPDRVVLDFPNTLPDAKLRDINVDRGELKRVRVGRFSSNPPVTRVVLDLKSAQSFQLFPSLKSVIIKLAASSANSMQPAPSATPAPAPTPAVAQAPPAPRVQVSFANGKLRIWANKATLAEVLAEVHHRTGAEVTFPPGAGQEPIVADLGPAPAREVLASLLNGSPFNFVMVGSDRDATQLRGIFLTARQGGADTSVSYPAVAMSQERQGPDQAMASPDIETPSESVPTPAQPDMVPNQQPQPEEAPPQPQQ
jgi:hypothetical protein